MDHVYATCAGCERGCMLCDGGLALCDVCRSLEGALTSECAGRYLSQDEENAVYAGILDYRDGMWIEASSPHSPAHYRAMQDRHEKSDV